MKQNKNIIIAGASPDTGNQGVTALCQSVVEAISSAGDHHITILDHGQGLRPCHQLNWATRNSKAYRLGFQAGRRFYRASNAYNAWLRCQLHLPSDTLSSFRQADVVMDVSGGDSFTDLYGPRRFQDIILPKKIALKLGKSLILLPQTYGPFRDHRHAAIAKSIIAKATRAYARDKDSFARMKTLLGDDFDAHRHRLGVDLAFGLSWQRESVLQRQNGTQDYKGKIGLNISGLLWHAAKEERARFGLNVDYHCAMADFVARFLTAYESDIVFVPHVRPSSGSGECDLAACRALRDSLPDRLKQRVFIEEDAQTPSALKTVIARLDWFAGPRMHATIAALSTGVPAVNLAYSDKARGVFACCGVGSQVMDLRAMSTDGLVSLMLQSYENRAVAGRLQKRNLPGVLGLWQEQLQDFLDPASRDLKSHSPKSDDPATKGVCHVSA